MEIDAHIGCAMSGLTADARTMVEHARMTGQVHAFTYDEPIKVESVTQAVCDLALRFGESVEDEDAMMVRCCCDRGSLTGPGLMIGTWSIHIVPAIRRRPADCRHRREWAATVRIL